MIADGGWTIRDIEEHLAELGISKRYENDEIDLTADNILADM